MELKLIRTYFSRGTNGELLLNGVKLCGTIELPWKNNKYQVSCIPEGRYELTKRYSLRFGWHLLVNNVPKRTLILIHAYNNALKESKGCIAPVSVITGHGEGIQSRISLKGLLELTNGEFRKGNKVFITIQSKQNEKSSGADEEADA